MRNVVQKEQRRKILIAVPSVVTLLLVCCSMRNGITFLRWNYHTERSITFLPLARWGFGNDRLELASCGNAKGSNIQVLGYITRYGPIEIYISN